MILSAQTIRKLDIITPFNERQVVRGRSYGLSSCGYDVRIDLEAEGLGVTTRMYPTTYKVEKTFMGPEIRKEYGVTFRLAATMEHFRMPDNVMGVVHDKSSWARQGLAVQNTVIEPNWRGFLTLELTYHGDGEIIFTHGDPIAQIIFHFLDEPTEQPYTGKYQNQEAGPQEVRFE